MANAKTLWIVAAVVATIIVGALAWLATQTPDYTPHYAFSNANYA